MGHYRADLACDICSEVRCTCLSPTIKPNNNFIVLSDFTIMTVAEFDADPRFNTTKVKIGSQQYSMPTNPFLYRMNFTQFRTREAAEIHAREKCEEAVEEARRRLLKLKNICKVIRPWEKK